MAPTTTPTIRLLPVMPTERTRIINAQARCRELEARARARGLSSLEATQLANARRVLADALRRGTCQ